MIIPKNTLTLRCDIGPSKCALREGIWHFSITLVMENLMLKSAKQTAWSRNDSFIVQNIRSLPFQKEINYSINDSPKPRITQISTKHWSSGFALVSTSREDAGRSFEHYTAIQSCWLRLRSWGQAYDHVCRCGWPHGRCAWHRLLYESACNSLVSMAIW